MTFTPDKEPLMSKKLEKLIEYVINDEEDKARALFHDIVVEKSRQIYEEMMDEEEMNEAKKEDDDEEMTEAEEMDEEDMTEAEEMDEEDMTESEELDEMQLDDDGDASDQLMSDIEAEEEGIGEADDDFADETGFDDAVGDEDSNADLEDRVVDLEDKLDELMAEFEELMGDDGDDMGGDMGDDMGDMDDEEMVGMDDEEDEMGMMEGVSLKAAPKPTTSEEGGINKKSTVAANSGARGMEGKPVHTGQSMGGKHDTSAYSNSHKDLISDFQNKAGGDMKDMKAAPKPVNSQASGVNNKSPLKGR
jgi:hypothetical protein